LEALDNQAENNRLNSQEIDMRKKLEAHIDKLWRVEEIKARQRARKKDIKEEDKNTTYFFVKANQRKRKKMIACLEEEWVSFNNNRGMLKHATDFYKKAFW
jgi:uncharacterized protein (UPF0335 family)